MRKLYFLFFIFCNATTFAEDFCEFERRRLAQEEVEKSYLERVFQNEADSTRFSSFLGQSYFFNDSGRWEVIGNYYNPSNLHEYLEEHARLGICPKGHKGIYLDKTSYDEGLWCCQGFMPDGTKCIFHIDKQYPNGIPKRNSKA